MLIPAHEVVNLLGRLLNAKDGIEEVSGFLQVAQRLLRVHVADVRVRRIERTSNFPVSLTIKLVSTDEQAAGGVTRPEKKQVGWSALVRMQHDQVADFDVPRLSLLDDSALQIQQLVKHSVDLPVLVVAGQVIHELFDQGYAQHENERQDERDQEADAQRGDYL